MSDVVWADEIAARLHVVEHRIAEIRRQVGRPRASVRLVAVSKRKPAAAIRAAYALGLRDFGENYAQELRDKSVELADLPDLRWHFIGPLQRNKVKLIVGRTALMHTVADPALIAALQERAARSGERLAVLVQLNLAGEQSKSGITADQLAETLARLDAADHLDCAGLMTMPPPADEPATIAPYFVRLRELLEAHQPTQGPAFRELSMGMSDDLEVAIEAGATLVRVGSAIFGARV